jgi:hypothetical protein
VAGWLVLNQSDDRFGNRCALVSFTTELMGAGKQRLIQSHPNAHGDLPIPDGSTLASCDINFDIENDL